MCNLPVNLNGLITLKFRLQNVLTKNENRSKILFYYLYIYNIDAYFLEKILYYSY